MTSAVKHKNATHIQWTVDTGNGNLLPLISKTENFCFMIQYTRCSLEFTRDGLSSSLFLKRYGTQIPEIDLILFSSSWFIYNGTTMHCNARTETLTIKSGCQKIWSHENNRLLRKSVTFDIVIHVKDSKRDECVQTASYLNSDLERLSKDFSHMLDSDLNHDAEIKCGEHSIKAHKNVLCARSDVFKAMLESNMVEGLTGVVEFQDIDISYIQDFVRYLYTGMIPELAFDNAKALYELGNKYLFSGLVLRCSEYMMENFSPENACLCLALAEVHSDEKLKDSVVNYIIEEKVYNQDEHWLPFCNRCPRLANEIYRMLQTRDGLEKKPISDSETTVPISTMTVLKKSTESVQKCND